MRGARLCETETYFEVHWREIPAESSVKCLSIDTAWNVDGFGKLLDGLDAITLLEMR